MRTSADVEQALAAYGDAVWRTCILYLPPSDAEDVFQDVFLKYTLHDGPFRDEGHRKAWLIRVAINACKDQLKASRSKNSSLDLMVENGQEAALGVQDEDPTALSEVLDAMDRLGDPPKTQLYLSLYEGYSAREISEMTGMPEGTVYSWISRGKKQLREALS